MFKVTVKSKSKFGEMSFLCKDFKKLTNLLNELLSAANAGELEFVIEKVLEDTDDEQ